jgi:hypothetical protein
MSSPLELLSLELSELKDSEHLSAFSGKREVAALPGSKVPSTCEGSKCAEVKSAYVRRLRGRGDTSIEQRAGSRRKQDLSLFSGKDRFSSGRCFMRRGSAPRLAYTTSIAVRRARFASHEENGADRYSDSDKSEHSAHSDGLVLKSSTAAPCRLTSQFSGRALRREARRVCIMKRRTCAALAPTYHGPLQLLVM